MACAQVQHQTTGSPHVEELSTMSLFTAAAAAAAQDPFAGICTSGRVAGKYAPGDDQMGGHYQTNRVHRSVVVFTPITAVTPTLSGHMLSTL